MNAKHPFFAKRAELRTWSRDHLEIRLAHSFLLMEYMEETGKKNTSLIDYLTKQLERHGADMDVINADVKRMKTARSKSGYIKNAANNRIKAEIKKEWDLWQDGKLRFANTNRFAEYVMSKYSFPKTASSIRKWNKNWRKEK